MRVDKNVKFNLRQEHVGDTLEARYTLGARRCKSLRAPGAFGLNFIFLNMLKNFLEARRPRRVSYTFRIRSRRVESLRTRSAHV